MTILEAADALEQGATGLTLEELQSLDARDDPEGAYILRLMAGAVAGLPERITMTATPRTVEMECQGGGVLPVEIFAHATHELLQAPLRRRLRHLVLGISEALRQGAAEIEVAAGPIRVFLTPRGSSLGEGNRASTGFLLRISWSSRSRCPEPHYIFDRFALSPIPIKVNGSLVNPALDVGECAVALELAGPYPVQVDSDPLVSASARCEEMCGWLLLGGDWSWNERPRIRVYFVVDGLGYPIDHLELGCSDLRAVIHAPGLPITPHCEELVREHVSVAQMLAQLARQVERAKVELARQFPTSNGRTTYSPGNLTLLRQVIRETRARGHVRQALQLAQKLSGEEPYYQEVAAGLAARLAQYPLARELAATALDVRRGSAGWPESLELSATVALECGEPSRAERLLVELEEIALLSPEGRTDLLERMSAALVAQGRYAEADRCAAEASALAAQELDVGHPGFARALLARSRACIAQDRLVEAALLSAQAAEQLAKEPLELARARVYQGLVQYLAGELEEADDRVGEAAARYRVRWGADHPELAAALLLRGLIHLKQGQPGKAGIVCTQSLEVLSALLGEAHPDVAAVHLALAEVRHRQSDWERAADHSRRAREIYSHRWGVAHPAVARTLERSARIGQERGLLRAAEEDAREAVRILSYALRQSEPLDTFPDSLGTVSYRWWELGDDIAARPTLTIPPARLGKELHQLVRALLQLVRVLRGAGKEAEAQVVLARARELRACRGTAALALAPDGPMRRSQHGFTVLLRLQAPGRVVSSLHLDTFGRPLALSSEGKVRVDEGLMVMKEPERRMLRDDEPLLSEPWGPQPVSFLLHAADPAGDGIRGKPRVITVAFREGPCLRVPVRL